jgi:hypothetical protein
MAADDDAVLFLFLAALVLGGATGAVVTMVNDRKLALRLELRRQAEAQGQDPDIVDAIAYVESHWDPSAKNLTGPDGARGGSYGPTQLSQKTARIIGYTGDMLDLCAPDGVLAGYWTAVYLSQRPGGGCPPGTAIEDAATWWNAGLGPDGRPRYATFDSLPMMVTKADGSKAPHPTRAVYAPAAIDALVMVQEDPPQESSA